MVNKTNTDLPNLLDFTLEEMEEFISSSGKEKYRARQIMKWLHQSGSLSFDDMTTLSRDFREKLAEIARIQRPEIVKIQKSQDGTQKALLRLEDGLFLAGLQKEFAAFRNCRPAYSTQTRNAGRHRY
jgi:23S rRNA (adenine2503-C2)-methyltransferase